jgi:hypothetical protein
MYLIRPTILIFCIFCFFSCKYSSDKKPDLSAVDLHLSYQDLSNELFACQSPEEVLLFLKKYPYLTQNFFDSFSSNDSIVADRLYQNIRSRDLSRFKKQIDSLFIDTSQPEEDLENAFKSIKYYFPDFKAPRIVSLTSGFLGRDLYISDSLIIIGLDYFGGEKGLYRPNVYDYQLRRYSKESLVPSILFILSDKYNQTNPNDRTLLGEMIGYGKAFEFVKKIMPTTADSLIINYSQEDLNRTYISQTELWAYLISNKLLYETNELKKEKYLGERPHTNEMGTEVPGAIGRWIGWRIVNLYLSKHPEITLPELMKEDNAQKILQESGYKGQADE